MYEDDYNERKDVGGGLDCEAGVDDKRCAVRWNNYDDECTVPYRTLTHTQGT